VLRIDFAERRSKGPGPVAGRTRVPDHAQVRAQMQACPGLLDHCADGTHSQSQEDRRRLDVGGPYISRNIIIIIIISISITYIYIYKYSPLRCARTGDGVGRVEFFYNTSRFRVFLPWPTR